MKEGDENAECDRISALSSHRFPIHNFIYTGCTKLYLTKHLKL